MEPRDHDRKSYRMESIDFMAQSRADLSTAITLYDAGIYYAAAFFCQQAAEKALKSAAIEHLQRCPRGHNLVHIANALSAPVDVMNAAAELNPHFLLARNPDAVEGVPAQMYDRDLASLFLACAQDILRWARKLC